MARPKAFKVCMGYIGYELSFVNLHKMCKRATPEMMMNYKLALCLPKVYNKDLNSIELVLLNFNQILTGQQTHFITSKSRNQLTCKQVLFDPQNNPWLNMSVDSFKLKCKEAFLIVM